MRPGFLSVSFRPGLFLQGLTVARSSVAISDASSPCRPNESASRRGRNVAPEMTICPRIDQLDADHNLVPDAAHASFEHVDHPERLRDLRANCFLSRRGTASPRCD